MPKNIEDIRFSASSIDAFFTPPAPPARIASGKVRIASATDLSGFLRVADDNTLVHLSQQDFWKLGKDQEGYFIERLVDDSKGPVKD